MEKEIEANGKLGLNDAHVKEYITKNDCLFPPLDYIFETPLLPPVYDLIAFGLGNVPILVIEIKKRIR